MTAAVDKACAGRGTIVCLCFWFNTGFFVDHFVKDVCCCEILCGRPGCPFREPRDAKTRWLTDAQIFADPSPPAGPLQSEQFSNMEDDELAAAEPVSPPQPVATARAEFDADLVRGHVTFLAGTCWARITCFLGQFADAIVVEEPLSDLPGGGVEAWSNGETTEQQEVDLELVNKVVEGLPEGVLSCALRPDLLL